MKTQQHQHIRGLLAARNPVVFALCVLLATSCATRRAVESIVVSSNAAILAGALGDVAGDPAAGEAAGFGSATNAAWRTAVEQVEQFAATHTNHAAILNPLRMREAMVLLQHQQIRLARDVFSQVDPKYLPGRRDQVLWQLRTNLVWYYGASKGKFRARDVEQGSAAVKQLDTAIEQLNQHLARSRADESIRDYLAVTRSWISLRLADSALTAEQQGRHFASAFNGYGSILDQNELRAIANPPLPSQRAELNLSDYRLGWAEALLSVATNASRFNPIPFEGVTNQFRDRLKPVLE